MSSILRCVRKGRMHRQRRNAFQSERGRPAKAIDSRWIKLANECHMQRAHFIGGYDKSVRSEIETKKNMNIQNMKFHDHDSWNIILRFRKFIRINYRHSITHKIPTRNTYMFSGGR